MADTIEERMRDRALDLIHDAASWRETADRIGGHSAATLTHDALENEALATEFNGFADEVESLRNEIKPAPRCDQCKHWNRFELETIGICNKAFETILFAVSSGELETREEFGCVAWEAK